MMIQFKVSAPGKVILFGEHAVVYGKTAIAASLGLKTNAHFTELPETEEFIKIYFPKVNLAISVPVQQIRSFFFMNSNVKSIDNFDSFYNQIREFVCTVGYINLQQKLSLEAFFYLLIYISLKEDCNIIPFQIHVSTELSIGSGLGSSASFAVCLAACFLHWSHLQKNIYKSFDAQDLENISKYALNCEKIMHGAPSGIDNSICTYGSVIEFKKGCYINPISDIPSMRILLVDTRVSRSTKQLLERVVDLKSKYPAIIDLIMESIDNISKEALKTIGKIQSNAENEICVEGYKQLMVSVLVKSILIDVRGFGGNTPMLHRKLKFQELINMNHGLLATCQVSHPSLDRICAEAQNYALAAKLTGAGGGGHAYILLLPDTQPETISSISRKLIADGFSVTLTTLGGVGVQVHN